MFIKLLTLLFAGYNRENEALSSVRRRTMMIVGIPVLFFGCDITGSNGDRVEAVI